MTGLQEIGRENGVTVFANGIFDLLHDGHIALLTYAKNQGDRLIVGINSDRATKLLKGEGRPVHSEEQRKQALLALSCVDEVIIFDDIRTTTTIMALQPHIVVKGAEWTTEEVRSKDSIPPHIQIVTFPLVLDTEGRKISTTFAIEHA